jgi:hypothetical protein
MDVAGQLSSKYPVKVLDFEIACIAISVDWVKHDFEEPLAKPEVLVHTMALLLMSTGIGFIADRDGHRAEQVYHQALRCDNLQLVHAKLEASEPQILLDIQETVCKFISDRELAWAASARKAVERNINELHESPHDVYFP